MQVHVHNQVSTNPIYTTIIDVLWDEDAEAYVVERNEKELARDKIRSLALAAACERILAGFRKEGLYRAEINGVPYAQKEVRG